MTRWLSCTVVGVALLATLPATALAAVIDIPVSFTVQNVNDSLTHCDGGVDEATYTVRGHITGPASMLGDQQRAITVYVHGSTIDQTHWRATGLPHLNYAQLLAEEGHTSLTFSELGYGASDKPAGAAVCKGAQATVLHQVVEQLRNGSYAATGPRPAFARIALAGQSSGALTAQIAAFSFGQVDALVQIGWANVMLPTEPVLEIVGHAGPACAQGGEQKYAERGEGPTGYAYAWPSAEAQTEDNWFDPPPEVVAAFPAIRERDPCGAQNSVVGALLEGNQYLHTISVPVLLLFGRADELFPPVTRQQQAQRFVGTDDLTFVELDQVGHEPVFDNGTEGEAREFRGVMSEWLRARGF